MKNKKLRKWVTAGAIFTFSTCLITACGKSKDELNEARPSSLEESEQMEKEEETTESTPTQVEQDSELTNKDMIQNKAQMEDIKVMDLKELEACFEGFKSNAPIKNILNNNPLMTQRLGADPYAIEYDGRVYIYMTGDVVEYDATGAVKANSYSKINTINVISSADLVNWTDHGSIHAAGASGASKWGNNSWAPAAAVKEVNGETKFFLYFANSGNGIGVVTSDSPTGPFVDPLGHALISRQTPNCSNVEWLFDPAVLVDDDGRAYLYFGGGVPNEQYAAPGTGRVVELGADMISIIGEPVALDVPYLFEDSGINKIGDTYYYSYCSNFNVSEEATESLGFASGEIVTMTSKSPMGPFTLQGPILKNPGTYFGCYGNNHHCIFQFKGKHYIAYHTQILESRLGVSGGYRSTNINEVTVNEDGSINMVQANETGVEQVATLNPYESVPAETMATMAGISTVPCDEESIACGSGNMAVTGIDTGDWIAVKGVEFGTEGAKKFSIDTKLATTTGAIQIRLDNLYGEVIGYVPIPTGDTQEFVTLSTELKTTVTGEHNLFFLFYGNGYELDSWKFSKN